MVCKTLSILALSASVAVAFPQRHHSHFHGTGFRGTGWAYPTGTSGDHNGSAHGTGAEGPAGSAVMTFTVSPLPEASSSADLIVTDLPSTAAAVVDASSTTCTSYSTSTEYATSVQFVTVTAGPERDVAAASSVVSLVSTSSVPAAAFYDSNRSWSHGGNNGWGAQSATTFATSVAASSAAPVASSATGGYGGASSATSAPAASTSTVSSGSSSGGKKGLSYNTPSLLNLFSGSGASWAYNWGLTSGGSMPSGVEYVPMCWGGDVASTCASSITSSGAKTMLSFNEPDLGAQSNMDVATAVSKHIQYVATPLSGKVRIGSPAVTNGGTGMGLDYLGQFLKQCNGKCAIDFLAIHWYDSATNFAAFKQHITDTKALANTYGIKSIWVTEFAGTGSNDAQAAFLQQAIPFLDSESMVERYAYFMVGSSQGMGMVDGTTLNAVGKAYDA